MAAGGSDARRSGVKPSPSSGRKALGRQVADAVFVPSAGLIDALQCVGDENATRVPHTCSVLREDDVADAGVHIAFLLLSPSA